MSKWDLLIKDGLIVTPEGPRHASLGVIDGKIAEIGQCFGEAKETYDAAGKMILPGCIEPHTHLGNNGNQRMSELIREESAGAAIGGVTSLVTTTPLTTTSMKELLDKAIDSCQGNSYVDFKLELQPLAESQFSEISQCANHGGNMFKFYMGYKGEEAAFFGMPTEGFTMSFIYRGFKEIADCGCPATPMIHAEEPFLGDEFKKKAMNSDKTDLQKWNDASPAECEMVDIFKAAVVAKSVGTALYVVHVSTGESVDLIRYLKKSGYNIIAETCLHYLMAHDGQDLGVLGKVKPPIRSEANREKIWQGVLDGTLTVIGTDTVPYTKKQKEVEFWSAPYGAGSGIGVLLPIMFSEGFIKRGMSIESLTKIMSENPAKAFGLYPQKGALATGFDADIVVIDPEKEFTVTASNMRNGSDFSIYEGLKGKGVPVRTYIRGEMVAADGKIVAPAPKGTFLLGAKPLKNL